MAGSSRYARTERERRFLLPGVPDLPAGFDVRLIEDRYLDGTRLRVWVVRQDGYDPVLKLGQKTRLEPVQPPSASDPSVAHTSLYLDRAEYELLRVLPGRDLTKTRTLLTWDGPPVAVDVSPAGSRVWSWPRGRPR